MNIFKISSEEKNLQLIYLIGLWIVMAVLFTFVCLKDYETEEIRGKNILLGQMEEKRNIISEQKLNISHIDSLNKMLTLYNPENKQVYLESGINDELNSLKKAYEKKKDEVNYKVFMQINTFYSMLYFDKKAVWNTVNNSNFLKKNLEECEVGFQQTQNHLSLQEALKNNNSK